MKVPWQAVLGAVLVFRDHLRRDRVVRPAGVDRRSGARISIGIAKQAGLMKNGRLPRAGRALLADAIGTVGSALVGNTTMVSYIEYASGVAVGGRTGLAALVTAALFLVAILFAGCANDKRRLCGSRRHHSLI